MHITLRHVALVAAALTVAGSASAGSARELVGTAPVVAIQNEPTPTLLVDEPLPDQLAMGRVVIQYTTQNLHIAPVFGKNALGVTPRVGHVHVKVDGAPWHWDDASGQPVVLLGMSPGKHKVQIQMADPTDEILQRETVFFVVPDVAAKAQGR
jgi:Family of unknown function (DUF6130)